MCAPAQHLAGRRWLELHVGEKTLAADSCRIWSMCQQWKVGVKVMSEQGVAKLSAPGLEREVASTPSAVSMGPCNKTRKKTHKCLVNLYPFRNSFPK